MMVLAVISVFGGDDDGCGPEGVSDVSYGDEVKEMAVVVIMVEVRVVVTYILVVVMLLGRGAGMDAHRVG